MRGGHWRVEYLWSRELDPNLWGAYRLEIISVSLEMSSLSSTLAYQLYTVCVYTLYDMMNMS